MNQLDRIEAKLDCLLRNAGLHWADPEMCCGLGDLSGYFRAENIVFNAARAVIFGVVHDGWFKPFGALAELRCVTTTHLQRTGVLAVEFDGRYAHWYFTVRVVPGTNRYLELSPDNKVHPSVVEALAGSDECVAAFATAWDDG